VKILTAEPLQRPVLDIASGDCRNGIFLAEQGVPVICCDVSAEALEQGRAAAAQAGVIIETWQIDLEGERKDPLPEKAYGGIIVFRYLHRQLMPNIKNAIKEGGVLIYETYTVEQPRFGKPRNPDFLLKPGELRDWFSSWDVIHYFEGIKHNPDRAIAQIVCRKPVKSA
jgi:SAM-dependent methyltransferase